MSQEVGLWAAQAFPLAVMGLILGVAAAVVLARVLRVSPLWTLGVGALGFAGAAAVGVGAEVRWPSPDFHLVSPAFLREARLVVVGMVIIGLAGAAWGWRRSGEATSSQRGAAAGLAGLGGVGCGLLFTSLVYLQESQMIDDGGRRSHGSSLLETLLPAAGFVLTILVAIVILILFVQPTNPRPMPAAS